MTSHIYPNLPAGFLAKSAVKVVLGGGVAFTLMEWFTGSERFYREQLMPMVHNFVDPEDAHRWGVRLAKAGLLPRSASAKQEYPELKCRVFDRDFKNPIGLAAGFDKDAEAVEGLRKCGFGFIEVGSITPLPQDGNPKPRIFRLLEDEAVINRYGFNSCGIGAASERIKAAGASKSDVPFGVNLGKNKSTIDAAADYEIGVNYVAPHCDYIVINVSSPNTPGLRALQNKNELVKILQSARACINRHKADAKLLLKIAPDLSPGERKDIAKICLDAKLGVDGLIVTNTTISRPSTLSSDQKAEVGGLSGVPLRQLSTQCVSDMYRLTGGKVPIVGCGGVASGADAYEKIRAGASLVQLYTALVYQGFPVVGRVKRELTELLQKDGFSNVQEAVGADHRKQ
ncbi:Protein DHOD-1 [Aphelenchoides avenae]|nr:Protein DHOD-1 [Aphelenchus avenae]